MKINEKLKTIRKTRNLSLRKLADLSGIEAGTINYYETKAKKIPASNLLKIANALNINYEMLFNDSDIDMDAVKYTVPYVNTNVVSIKNKQIKKSIINSILFLFKNSCEILEIDTLLVDEEMERIKNFIEENSENF